MQFSFIIGYSLNAEALEYSPVSSQEHAGSPHAAEHIDLVHSYSLMRRNASTCFNVFLDSVGSLYIALDPTKGRPQKLSSAVSLFLAAKKKREIHDSAFFHIHEFPVGVRLRFSSLL